MDKRKHHQEKQWLWDRVADIFEEALKD